MTKLAIIGSVVGGAVILIAIWFFAIYDTAAGKCNRGDLGACLVVYAQQSASAEALAVSVSASAAEASATAQANFDARMASGCTVGPPVAYDVRVTFVGQNKQGDCATATSKGWVSGTRVTGASVVCDSSGLTNDEVVVEDTGGQHWGGLMCQGLSSAQLEGWNDIDPEARNAADSAAHAVVTDIQSLSTAGDTINTSMSSAAKDLQTAQTDLNQTAADLQSASSCSDAYRVQSDAYTVQSDQYSMQSVQYSEQAATGQVHDEISALVSDFKTLQSAEAAASGYVPVSNATANQVNAAASAANGAIAQGDKTMASYLAKVQVLLDKANGYAATSQHQYC